MAEYKKEDFVFEKFRSATDRQPCPICGGTSKCSFNSYMACCARVESKWKSVNKKPGAFCDTWNHYFQGPRARESLGNIVIERAPRVETSERASRDDRNVAYRIFLQELTFSNFHKNKLGKSGVDIPFVEERLYRTVPNWKERKDITKRVMTKLGKDMKGIPGFYLEDKYGTPFWTFGGADGFFVPVYDEYNRIIALRIRVDKPKIKQNGKEDQKYFWFSSGNKKYGCGVTNFCHVALGNLEEIWITEGEKKADMSHHVTEYTVVSIPGFQGWSGSISVIKNLIEIAKKQGVEVKRIRLCYDADLPTIKLEKQFHPITGEQLYGDWVEKNYANTLVNEFPEIQVLLGRWIFDEVKKEGFKGIDDLLQAGGSPIWIYPELFTKPEKKQEEASA